MTLSRYGPRLFWIDIDRHAAQLPVCADLLDTDERARARSYVFDVDRRRFVIARGFLRMMLAKALRVTTTAITFDFTTHGKPFVAWPQEGRGLHFSVSHAGGFALIGMAWRHPVGVDVERVRDGIDHARMAERIFSPHERTALADIQADLRARAFFGIWTRKEAYVKAHGLGLSMPLDSFDVAVAQASSEWLLATRPDPDEAARWSVQAIAAPPGYAAAIACSTRAS